MTNLIGEFIGEEDKKEYYSKTLLFSKEFNKELKWCYVNDEDDDEAEIRQKLFDLGHSVNSSEVLFYEDDNGSPIVSFKQFYNERKWFKGNYLEIAEYDLNIYDDDDITNLFEDYINGDDALLCYIETSHIAGYLRGCGISLTTEQIDYMKDFNNEIALSILCSLVKDNLIDNTISFTKYMMEDSIDSKLAVIEILFGERDIRIELSQNRLLVLGN
jgi:hypothetical protein